MAKNIIFVLPHLRVNTTSVSRFKCLIKAALDKGHNVRILEFSYPLQKNVINGHQDSDKLLENYIEENLISIQSETNLLQKAAFNLINKNNSFWKCLNWVHQGVYKTDVFYARNSLNFINLKLSDALETYVIAFGGPFSVFTFGSKLAKSLKAHLVLDYRDPWNFGYAPIDCPETVHFLKKKLLTNHEKSILEQAKVVTTVSTTLKKFLPEQFHNKTLVYINGTEFSSENVTLKENFETFNIVYSGTIYNEQLFDDTFFKAFKNFVNSKSLDKIKLFFLGASDNSNLKKKLKEFDILDYCVITDRLTKEELLTYYNEASLFLHLKYGNRKGVITSKQADYLFFNKPILLPVSDDGDIKDSIQENNAGFICNSVLENEELLNNLWTKFCQKQPYKYNLNRKDIQRDIIAENYINQL